MGSRSPRSLQAPLEAGLVERRAAPAARESLQLLAMPTRRIFEGIQRLLARARSPACRWCAGPVPISRPAARRGCLRGYRRRRRHGWRSRWRKRRPAPVAAMCRMDVLSGGIDSATVLLTARLNSTVQGAAFHRFVGWAFRWTRRMSACRYCGEGAERVRSDRDQRRGDGLNASARDRCVHGRSGGGPRSSRTVPARRAR